MTVVGLEPARIEVNVNITVTVISEMEGKDESLRCHPTDPVMKVSTMVNDA